MGAEFKRDQKTYAWYGKWVNDYNVEQAAYNQGVKPEDYGKCLHAIHFPDCRYEAGIIEHPDGDGYALIYDVWDKQLGKKFKNDAFEEAYQIEKVVHEAELEGDEYEIVVAENGDVVITVGCDDNGYGSYSGY